MGKVVKLRPTPPEPLLIRPVPPSLDGSLFFVPAPDVRNWALQAIVEPSGPIHNPKLAHLADGDIEFLWAAQGYIKQGRMVLGTAEQVAIRAGGWQKLRQEQQFAQWFGRVPGFLITLDAEFCRECDDASFCALVEHELSHIAHKLDEFGAPRFNKDTGLPILTIQDHDVAEFHDVVERYGPSDDVRGIIQAAGCSPTIRAEQIALACGVQKQEKTA